MLFIDEIEKGLAGVSASGAGDSGVSARMFGTLLTYLNDHETDVFVVVTANDISKLPPEFFRSERFDAVFMIDLPGRQEKNTIWEMYLAKFGLDARQARPADDQWTGAEIRAAAAWRRSWTCRFRKPLRMWCRWRSLRPNQSSDCGVGQTAVVSALTSRVSIGTTPPRWSNRAARSAATLPTTDRAMISRPSRFL